MSQPPDWLTKVLSAATSPEAACSQLLFHGTLELFEGRLSGTGWEGLRWSAQNPSIAQSYCPEAGLLTGWSSPLPHEVSERLLPIGDINRIIFRALGFDERQADVQYDDHGLPSSWRILPGHPTNADAILYLAKLGYDTRSGLCWIKTRRSEDTPSILPADHKQSGRLFILERPADLRIFDYAKSRDGGLSGQQWMHTDIFRSLAASGAWDGVLISDVHQTKMAGHFEHPSIGLFEPTLAKLRFHVIDAVHFEPSTLWGRTDGSTTPEFDQLWEDAQSFQSLAA